MEDNDVGSGAAMSASSFLVGGMTIRECQEVIQKSFSNPKVKTLVENLEKSGCKIGPNFIRAIKCKGSFAGAYSRGKGIVICSNHMRFEDYVVQAVIHELIHAYDDCRAANMDWRSPVHQACTEIRANHLSGDCHIMREFLRGNLEKIKGHEPKCVKQRSTQSVGANHPPEVAKAAVEAVWDTCYNDTAPFAQVP